jgi:hypothetical protein
MVLTGDGGIWVEEMTGRGAAFNPSTGRVSADLYGGASATVFCYWMTHVSIERCSQHSSMPKKVAEQEASHNFAHFVILGGFIVNLRKLCPLKHVCVP